MTKQTLAVRGMTCGGCENAVRNALSKLDGVFEVRPDHASDQVSLRFDEGKVTEDTIRQRIRDAGYEC